MICRICTIDKNQDEFYFRPDTGKYRTECIPCNKAKGKAHYERNREKYIEMSKRYVVSHKEQHNANSKTWCENNPDRRKEIVNKYYLSHKEAIKHKTVKWFKENTEKAREIRKREHEKNKERYQAYSLKYTSMRYKSDPTYRINHNMARAINSSLKKNKDGRKWSDLLGYDVSDLQIHLEKKFVDGMTWENYGKVWHVDHIIPISVFNISSYNDYDFKRCWSLKNLQPMFAEDNFKKHNKLENPFQPCLL